MLRCASVGGCNLREIHLLGSSSLLYEKADCLQITFADLSFLKVI